MKYLPEMRDYVKGVLKLSKPCGDAIWHHRHPKYPKEHCTSSRVYI